MLKIWRHFRPLFKTYVPVLLVFQLVNIGCATFPFHSKMTPASQNENIKFNLVIDPVVKDSDGKDYFRLEDSVIQYADHIFQGCHSKCLQKLDVDIRFVADSNSRDSKLFKIWQWSAFVTLGIIPVYEKTNYTLIAEIKTPDQVKRFEKAANSYLIFSIVLFPFNIFRDWREDSLSAQKILLDQMLQEVSSFYPSKG